MTTSRKSTLEGVKFYDTTTVVSQVLQLNRVNKEKKFSLAVLDARVEIAAETFLQAGNSINTAQIDEPTVSDDSLQIHLGMIW